LALQAEQAVEGAGCGVGVLGQHAGVLPGTGTEIHQTATESEQHGGQAGRGDRQGFSVGHGNVLK
jgi:hypothetical protein